MDYDYSVALIVSTDTEEFAVRNMYPDWTAVSFPEDNQTYYEVSFPKGENTYRVVYGRQMRMGMTAAASLSMKMIQRFHPRYLIMTGIAAALSREDMDDDICGDVIVADTIWNHAYGNFVPPDQSPVNFGNLGFQAKPSSIRMDQSLRGYVEMAMDSSENQNHVHFGPMASGSTVVANAKILNQEIHSQYSETAGLDMEAYAVAYAAQDAPEPRPKALIIKSVCDYGDPRNTEEYRKFAACNSAEFTKLLYEKFLPL